MPAANSIHTQYVRMELLRPNEKPLRIHNRAQRRKIAKLFQLAGGQPVPIITNSAFQIIDGHGIYHHLEETGATEALVTVLHSPTETEARALRILLNRIVEDTRWNAPNLQSEFLDLVQEGYDLLDTGFEPAEIDRILTLDIPADLLGEDHLDVVPPLQEHAIARPGDIFQLGDTGRCGCGDARDKSFVDRVCNGAVADVCITEPIRRLRHDGVGGREGETRHRDLVAGKAEPSTDDCFALFHDSMQVLKSSSAPHALIYIFTDWSRILELTAAGRQLGLPLMNICAWIKSDAGPGSLYRPQHDLCVVFKAGTDAHRNTVAPGRSGRKRSNVWQYPNTGFSAARRDKDRTSLASKPVLMLSDILRDVTQPGDAVLDPFCGSGSTIIAAEHVGRRCFAIELNPHHVDVAVRRWQRITGRDAIHLPSGMTFDDYAQHQMSTMLTGQRQ